AYLSHHSEVVDYQAPQIVNAKVASMRIGVKVPADQHLLEVAVDKQISKIFEIDAPALQLRKIIDFCRRQVFKRKHLASGVLPDHPWNLYAGTMAQTLAQPNGVTSFLNVVNLGKQHPAKFIYEIHPGLPLFSGAGHPSDSGNQAHVTEITIEAPGEIR